MTEGLRELGSYIEQKRNDCVISWGIDNNELNITVAPSNIANFVDFLRSDSRCKFSTKKVTRIVCRADEWSLLLVTRDFDHLCRNL